MGITSTHLHSNLRAPQSSDLTPLTPLTLLTLNDLERVTTLNKRTIQRLVISGDFPMPRTLPGSGINPRRRAWRSDDIKAWIAALPAAHVSRAEGVVNV